METSEFPSKVRFISVVQLLQYVQYVAMDGKAEQGRGIRWPLWLHCLVQVKTKQNKTEECDAI